MEHPSWTLYCWSFPESSSEAIIPTSLGIKVDIPGLQKAALSPITAAPWSSTSPEQKRPKEETRGTALALQGPLTIPGHYLKGSTKTPCAAPMFHLFSSWSLLIVESRSGCRLLWQEVVQDAGRSMKPVKPAMPRGLRSHSTPLQIISWARF